MSPESILFAAIKKAIPAELKAYLDEVCGNDLKLRQEIEGLLQANAAPGALKDMSAIQNKEITADYPGTLHQNMILSDRYQLIEPLGEGGMGEVWVARQSEPVKRKVAIKFIKTGMDSRAVLARFEQERQALAVMD